MRTVLAAVAMLLAAPAWATTLRYVPAGDLRILDPIWTSAAITLNHAQMIYDVLVTSDSQLRPRLQMAESYARSDDGLRSTFVLRPGLMFHDGTPVRSRDVAASILRWGQRVTAGQAVMSHLDRIDTPDDRTLTMVFHHPFGPLLEALGSPLLAPFVMREQDAKTSAFEQVKTTVGSGPFMFVTEAYRAGDRALYRRFPGYVPRDEPADGYAGGRVARVDEVEWRYLPDPATATQALQTGEMDFLEAIPADLVPLVKGRSGLKVEVLNTAGSIGTIRPNAAHPPFDDARARQALMLIADQAEFGQALTNEPGLSQVCHALFVCGTPYATEAGAAPWSHPDIPRAKALLQAAGYDGRPLVLLDPSDQPDIHTLALVFADQLRRAGIAVDVQTMDWSSILTRRNTRASPMENKSGWDIAFTFWGGISLASPLTNTPLVSSCDGKNLYGWPCDEPLEKLRADFLDATTPAAQMAVIEALQRRYFEVAPYISTGVVLRQVAHRSILKDVLKTPYPVFWNIRKEE